MERWTFCLFVCLFGFEEGSVDDLSRIRIRMMMMYYHHVEVEDIFFPLRRRDSVTFL